MPPETSHLSYFDPLVLAKIANMSLRARHVVEGLLSGLHDSPYTKKRQTLGPTYSWMPVPRWTMALRVSASSITVVTSLLL